MRPRITTKRGYDFFEVASALQKAIRRADTPVAGYTAVELFESGFAAYVWKRLLTISAEDVAGIVTQEIKALHDAFLLISDNGKKPKGRVFIAKAVIVLCQARKSRDADHLTNFVYDRQMIDAQKLDAAIDEARANPENMPLPDYTFDGIHTRRGKRRTVEQFCQEEHAALKPREQGEFDYTQNT